MINKTCAEQSEASKSCKSYNLVKNPGSDFFGKIQYVKERFLHP